MRVALTGGSGFTGGFVVDALVAANVDYVCLPLDLTNAAAVERAVVENAFDRIIHLAGAAFVNQTNWNSFYSVNQIGTFNLLTSIARHKPSIRCVLASTAQVYGPGAAGLITENAAINPVNHYAVSKCAMEMGASIWNDYLDIVITRPFNYTGVGQGLEYLIPKLVDHFRENAPVIELGNTWVRRDIGDVRSVADAYVKLAMENSACPVVNICTGVVYSIDEILAILTELSGHSIEVRVNPAFVRQNDVPVLGGDAALLRSLLPTWRPRALRDTLAWMYAK